MLYRMGYFSNQSGIMRRYLREEGAWETHLNKTANSILSAISREKPKFVAVLGSGWLLDIPMQEMLQQGILVKLVDIVHPTRIVHMYRNHKGVEIVECDITNSIQQIWNFCKRSKSISYQHIIEDIRKSGLSGVLDVDLVLSINILSQLHVLIVDFLESKTELGRSQKNEIISAIQQAHIDLLPAGRSLLITDCEEESYDENNHLVGVNPRVIAHMDHWQKKDSWQWQFDTKRMFSGDQKVILNVASYWKEKPPK